MIKKIKGQYRQGDVLIEETLTPPPSRKPDLKGRIVLAHGEVTGHSHDVIEGEAWKDGEDVSIVRVKRRTAVEHQDHRPPISLRRKMHNVIRQREYHPQAIRRVDSGAKEIHRDDFGILYRKPIPNDEDMVMVKVVNATAEDDGSFKDYFLRVPPDMQRAHQAVAWTFDKTEETYAPEIET